ncbi:MAG: hypothetical protein MK213_07140 [Planctomycetes bacterium]|nr:hypothetical protein [Planctomycetota bacterium]
MLSALIPAIAWLFSTPLLLGLVEYYGAYLGNDVADVWVASGLILLLLARGFRAPRSSHGLSSALATAGLCLGVSSFFPLFLDAQSLLPPIWLKWISGALLVAFGYFPLGWLGSHLSARTLTHGVGSWIAGSLGCFAGASAMTHWGLGVPGVLVSTTGLACVTALPIPEVRNFHTPGSQSSIKERAGFIFTLLGLFFAWQYALPLLGTFDQGSSLQVSRRIATLGALGIAGAWAIGGPISDSNKSAGWIAVLATMCACALTRFEGHIEELSIQRTFQGLVSDPRLLNLLGLKEPIGQDHPLFVPFVTLVLAGLLAILSGALLRACAGQRMEGNGPASHQRMSGVRRSQPSGPPF